MPDFPRSYLQPHTDADLRQSVKADNGCVLAGVWRAEGFDTRILIEASDPSFRAAIIIPDVLLDFLSPTIGYVEGTIDHSGVEARGDAAGGKMQLTLRYIGGLEMYTIMKPSPDDGYFFINVKVGHVATRTSL